MYACLEREFRASAMVTIVAVRTDAAGGSYPSYEYGGIFFAKSSRADINVIADVAGKRLEGFDTVSLGAAQSQWREMARRQYSFWNLPSQVMFVRNQNQIIIVSAGGIDRELCLNRPCV